MEKLFRLRPSRPTKQSEIMKLLTKISATSQKSGAGWTKLALLLVALLVPVMFLFGAATSLVLGLHYEGQQLKKDGAQVRSANLTSTFKALLPLEENHSLKQGFLEKSGRLEKVPPVFPKAAEQSQGEEHGGSDYGSGQFSLAEALSLFDNTDQSPTSGAWHNLTDSQLFSLAKETSKNRTTSPPASLGTKKIAFLFLTRGPLPLAKLWQRFFSEHRGKFSIYIHTKPGFVYGRFLPRVFRGRQIPSQKVQWGSITIVDAERRLLANALLDPDNERFVLVSETCIPLYNFTFVYNYLMSATLSFLSVYDDRGPYGRGRYNMYFKPQVSIEQWRKGSQWFAVTREIGTMIVADTIFHKKFRFFCRGGLNCFSDEHYLPTMMNILAPEKLANISVTYVDWSRRGWHPRTFYRVNSKVLNTMRQPDKKCPVAANKQSVCFLFARKIGRSALPDLYRLSTLGF